MLVEAKICGLSDAPTLMRAVAGGAAYAGFVFYPSSPRNLSLESAARLAALVPQQVRRVGVFVDPDPAALADTIATARLDIVQLHQATLEKAAVLKHNVDCPVWVAVPIATANDLNVARQYRGIADRLIYDAKTPAGALPGGMGLRFDWNLLRDFDHPLPWALSGGLDADNVAEAIRITGATVVDVSSGVEQAPGIKDMDKIDMFLKAATAA